MKPDDRTRALNAAAIHLDWLTDPDYHRTRQALTLLADTDTRAAIRAGSLDTEGRRAKGGHSDPTASTAGTRVDSGAQDRRTTKAIHLAIIDIAETAQFIRFTISGEILLNPNSGTLTTALADTLWCLTIPHAIGAWTTDDDEQRGEVDHACDHLARQTAVLQSTVAKILTAAVRPASEKPKQIQRVNCASCRRFGLDVDCDDRPRSTLCQHCRSFRKNHECSPTEAICRLYAAGSLRVTPGMIAEAKAKARATSRRRRASA